MERLRESIDEKAAEVQRLMQEASQLRQMNLTLETDAQLAKDAAAQSERKLNSAQEVRQHPAGGQQESCHNRLHMFRLHTRRLLWPPHSDGPARHGVVQCFAHCEK